MIIAAEVKRDEQGYWTHPALVRSGCETSAELSWGSTPEPPIFPACNFLVFFLSFNYAICNSLSQSFHPFYNMITSGIFQSDTVHLYF
ncbi:TPA: hypothetical protein L9W43_004804 [Klebsiella pneumoniae]|nr:hypothetical protein [Klebsiella pneumoniae]